MVKFEEGAPVPTINKIESSMARVEGENDDKSSSRINSGHYSGIDINDTSKKISSFETEPIIKPLDKEFVPGPVLNLVQTGALVAGPGALQTSIPVLLGARLPKLAPEQQDNLTRAKKFAMEQTNKMDLTKQTLAYQQLVSAKLNSELAKSLERKKALELMCCVYVGSIGCEVKEYTLRQAFLPFGPIKVITMHMNYPTYHKPYAFVEYDIPEAAQLSLEQMNGMMVGGRIIQVVGRTIKMPQTQSEIDEITKEAKQYNRIYVASIHSDITKEDIKTVFEVYGPIKYCRLQPGSTPTLHNGYAFIEYETQQAAHEAINCMNLFNLRGQNLRVGRAITPPNAVAAAAATANIQAMDAVVSNTVALRMASRLPLTMPAPVTPGGIIPPPGIAIPTIRAPTLATPVSTALPMPMLPPPVVLTPTLAQPVSQANSQDALRAHEQAQQKQQDELHKKLLEESEPQTLQQEENISIKDQSARHLVMQKLMRKVESRVVILRNMLEPDDMDKFLQEECRKFGRFGRVIVYDGKQSKEEDDDAEVIVKIFVEFSQMSEAENARDALNGRYFGGRMIKCELYDQTLFNHSDFSN